MGLFGRKQTSTSVDVTVLDGQHQLAIVGESHYQDALWRQAGVARGTEVRTESIAILVPEPDNQYDKNAIAVVLPTGRAGYLSREDAATYAPGLRSLMDEHKSPIALRCVIIGGGHIDDRAKSLGVWLYHSPSDFGIDTEAPPLRTGRSATRSRSWQDGLPDDSIKRIAYLRKALTVESAPVDRHFVCLSLEETLYKCRTVFASALEEYESVAEAHHNEMLSIVPALLSDFDGIPTLPSTSR
jgi:hypothetical protein